MKEYLRRCTRLAKEKKMPHFTIGTSNMSLIKIVVLMLPPTQSPALTWGAAQLPFMKHSTCNIMFEDEGVNNSKSARIREK